MPAHAPADPDPPHARATTSAGSTGHDSRSRPLSARLTHAMVGVTAWLPLPLLHGLGSVVGLAGRLLARKSLRRADITLRLALPELGPAERRRLARRSLRHVACAGFESGVLLRADRPRITRLIKQISGRELIDQAVADGRGVLLLTAHLGAWELVPLWASLHYQSTTLFRPPRVRELDLALRAARNRFGGLLAPTGFEGVRALHKGLRQGHVCTLLPDQDAGAGMGIFVPFMGSLANTGTLTARLIARDKPVVLMARAERLSWGRGFTLMFREAPADCLTGDLEQATCAINDAVGQLIRELPEQYLWRYRRYKNGPPGYQDPYRMDGLP